MKKLVIGNIKMNILSLAEREHYFKAFKKEIREAKLKNVEIILCPPFMHIESFAKNLKSKKVRIGAQDIFWEQKGSYTGEISPLMVKNLKGEFVIVGHSERRNFFGETDETVNLKIKSALKSGLIPIFCVGETKEEKETDSAPDVISRQIYEGLRDISRTQIEKVIFVYEPIWSIGTDVVPTDNEVLGAQLLIRKLLTERYGSKYAQKARIIYGGSVKDKIVCQVCVEPRMDGVLVGRESLIPHELVKIAEIIDKN